jgi:hypothetical protein
VHQRDQLVGSKGNGENDDDDDDDDERRTTDGQR